MLEKTPGKTTVTRFTIWDNYARHCDELRAVGVPDGGLEELRLAAAAVEEAEQAESRLSIDLERALSPYTTSCGWVIQPPTVAARYWARLALVKVTGGRGPETGLGELLALLAGLLVLRLWGEGRADEVMQLVSSAGTLAERLAHESESVGDLDPDQLGRDWLALMGIQPVGKKKALARYRRLLRALAARHSRRYGRIKL